MFKLLPDPSAKLRSMKGKKKTLLLSVIGTMTTMSVQLLKWNLNEKLQKMCWTVGRGQVDRSVHMCAFTSRYRSAGLVV